ncbi:MAG: hypothetical protein JXA20_17770 [Spirochaetes bacterium]|nr:hypothetical protein [Spirochaetota bacterium]
MRSRSAGGGALRYLAAAAVLLCLLPGAPLGGTDPAVVTLSILSKQIRLVGEGKLDGIGIALPHDAAVTDLLRGETVLGGELRLVSAGGEPLTAGRVVLLRNGSPAGEGFSILVQRPGGEMEVSFAGETRRYPLPAQIRSRGGGTEVIVTEEAARYAADSAAAEYGALGPHHGEAMKALTMLIYAKVIDPKTGRAHGDCDFCDLSHCQVYRGRTGAGTNPIRWWPLTGGYFFHARCGGKTMGCATFGGDVSGEGNALGDGDCTCVPVKCAAVGHKGPLCGGGEWSASLGEDELAAILFGGSASPPAMIRRYDRERMRVEVSSGDRTVSYPAEGFRLAVNRVRGWSFIASNNYSVTEETRTGRRIYTFRGRGLGHGVGLCQEGAKTLAGMGYSAVEILEHYFPGSQWRGAAAAESPTPYLSYVLFSLEDGSVEFMSYPRFAGRRVPPGSLFKVLVSIYLALHRPDLLERYRHVCTGAEEEGGLPACWYRRGHGEIAFREALSKSCNRYFASLCRQIDREEFARRINVLFLELGMQCRCPVPANDRDFAAMLCGTDFRMRISVEDIMILAGLLGTGGRSGGAIARVRQTIPQRHLALIREALMRNITEGTGSGEAHPFGPELNYRDLLGPVPAEDAVLRGVMWGKTATVVDGPVGDRSYGIFMGGFRGTGIVVLLSRGNGHLAAQWARRIMAARVLPHH